MRVCAFKMSGIGAGEGASASTKVRVYRIRYISHRGIQDYLPMQYAVAAPIISEICADLRMNYPHVAVPLITEEYLRGLTTTKNIIAQPLPNVLFTINVFEIQEDGSCLGIDAQLPRVFHDAFD